MHLRQLQLGLGAHARREREVADDVAERLSAGAKSAICTEGLVWGDWSRLHTVAVRFR